MTQVKSAETKLHRFTRDVSTLDVPQQFTFPFYYVPCQLSVEAAHEVQDYVDSRKDWAAELAAGKMLGVLVVRDTDGQLGFLASFSGNLAGSSRHTYFVPPIYDLLKPHGEFRSGEAEITAITHEIDRLEHCGKLQLLHAQLTAAREQNRDTIDSFRAHMQQSRAHRHTLRQTENLTPVQMQALIAESQFQKAELKRIKKRAALKTAAIEAEMAAITREANALRTKRKLMSERLQQRIFSLFVVQNARGERRDLTTIFRDFHSQNHIGTPSGRRQSAQGAVPPSGTGECCAPKLLQYAYLHQLKPVCMAEFWWGRSPAGTARRHGEFYPACHGKCLPILNFMLQGLDVEPNPLAEQPAESMPLNVIYEDLWIVAANKPAGMLSVPGKLHGDSLQTRLRKRSASSAFTTVAHRLDMATSGIVVAAKDPNTLVKLQRQFQAHSISKRYVAIVQGWPAQNEGIINLPLRPDVTNRPLQMLDRACGKTAVTRYHVMERMANGTARVEFFPLTGRTHQLRLHAALPQGLNCPIVGDMLYGHPAPRLMLHAQKLSFVHPATGQTMTLTTDEPF